MADSAVLERYRPQEAVVGKGSTSSVVLALDTANNSVVALKTVDKRRVSKDLIIREICAQLSVSGHPNICTLFDAVEGPENYTLVQEFLPNGDLFDVIPADLGMHEVEVWECCV
jgi:serine/threonine protein kinase